TQTHIHTQFYQRQQIHSLRTKLKHRKKHTHSHSLSLTLIHAHAHAHTHTHTHTNTDTHTLTHSIPLLSQHQIRTGSAPLVLLMRVFMRYDRVCVCVCV